MGRRMEYAGLAKTAAGRVREGMKVVIFATLFPKNQSVTGSVVRLSWGGWMWFKYWWVGGGSWGVDERVACSWIWRGSFSMTYLGVWAPGLLPLASFAGLGMGRDGTYFCWFGGGLYWAWWSRLVFEEEGREGSS
jgi:hypothetical protein